MPKTCTFFIVLSATTSSPSSGMSFLSSTLYCVPSFKPLLNVTIGKINIREGPTLSQKDHTNSWDYPYYLWHPAWKPSSCALYFTFPPSSNNWKNETTYRRMKGLSFAGCLGSPLQIRWEALTFIRSFREESAEVVRGIWIGYLLHASLWPLGWPIRPTSPPN